MLCHKEKSHSTAILQIFTFTVSRYFEGRCLKDSVAKKCTSGDLAEIPRSRDKSTLWTGWCMKNSSSLSHVQSIHKWWNFNIKPDQILGEKWDQDRMDNWFTVKVWKSWWNKALLKNCAHVPWPEFKIRKERSPVGGSDFLQTLPFVDNLQSYPCTEFTQSWISSWLFYSWLQRKQKNSY